jgi:hypothetical protein
MDGHLLNVLADQAIVVERHLSCQSGELYLAIFWDFNVAIDTISGCKMIGGKGYI